MAEGSLKFTNRWMFNRVMCEEDVCREVLRAVTGIEAGEIVYLNAEQCYEPAAAEKGVHMDVVARESGRVYDIEMQVDREPSMGRRLRYYQAAMDVASLDKGHGYGKLPESYIVFFCTYDPFGLGLPIYTIERTCIEAPEMSIGDGSHWTALNARAWPEAAGSMGEVLEYVGTGKVTGPLTQRIEALVAEFNRDKGWVGRVHTLEQEMEMQRERGLAQGREEGRAEGRAEGLAEAGALIAALMDDGRFEDARRAATDADYREELLRELEQS